MERIPDELRLLILLAINALVVIASVRFARRKGERDAIQIALDVMLLWYLVQYLSVGIPGILGVLSASSMLGTAMILIAIMHAIERWHGGLAHAPLHTGEAPVPGAGVTMVCVGMLIAFIGAVISTQRFAPPSANDALTYHLPAAMQWIATGKVGLFQTWYFNPANAYSPLAGSMFITWLMAPLRADAIAQFVEAPALLMILFAMLQLNRALGASRVAASLVALAACCARPFISQSVLTKDDLFVAAFFITAIVAMSKRSPWRFGIALGLLLATKYTAVLCVPVLLLGLKSRRVRSHAIATGCALVIAGPWYLRNAIWFGNPLYPIDLPLLHGMFTPARAHAFSSARGIFRTLADSYASMPLIPSCALFVIWMIAAIRARASMRDPIVRVLLIGPLVGIAIFVATSPYPEARFVYPIYLLIIASAALAIRRTKFELCISVALVVLMIATSFVPVVLKNLSIPFVVILLAIFLVMASTKIRYAFLVPIIAFGILIYVYWQAFLHRRRDDAVSYWRAPYGELATAWGFLRDRTGDQLSIAYANTHFVYPLFGDGFDRSIAYIPTRAGVRTLADLGHLDGRISGEDLPTRVIEAMNRDADHEIWLRNLRASGAKILFIAKNRIESPELKFLENDARFKVAFENSAAKIMEISW